MGTDLQTLIDDIAARLNAPAVLEDDQQRMVVYSSHSAPIDEVRRDSILRRTTRPAIRDWFRRFGITRATAPFHIPGDAHLAVLGRLCAPIRYSGRLIGFLWLIDDDNALAAAEVREVERLAQHAGMLMYEDELAERLRSTLLAHLISPSEELRAMAADQVTSECAPIDDTVWTIAVVRHETPAAGVTPERIRAAVTQALRDLVRRHPHGCVLTLVSSDHSVLLHRADPDERADHERAAAEVRALATEALEALRSRTGRGGRTERATRDVIDTVVGIGDARRLLTDVHASAREARLAARVASVVPAVRPVAGWNELGAYRALVQLSAGDAMASLDPRVTRLLGDATIVETIETYLDSGCDAQVTATGLHLHRTTLYHRLQRANHEYGIDLRTGFDRLAAHTGLKLARLAGLSPDAGATRRRSG